MKNKILNLVAIVFAFAAVLISCKSSTEKAQDNMQVAKENVVIANQELNQAIRDSIQLFKQESELKISTYDKKITELKAAMANQKIENKAAYEKTLAELEQKNNNLKNKLADLKDDTEENWTSFKTEFNHDMDELGKALKDLTVNNK